MTTAPVDPGSYRDRRSRVLDAGGDVLRVFSPAGWEQWRAVAATAFYQRLVSAKKVVASEEAPIPPEAAAALPAGIAGAVRHARVPFVTYPYEWPFGMLRAAALLQLELLAEALDEGFTLRDASPYNVQWLGSRPTFIDVGSFERRVEGEPWVGYLQFCQLFLYPLLLTAYRDVRFHPWLRGSLEGITPEECRRLLRPRDLLRPGTLFDVSLQARLIERTAANTHSVRGELRGAGFTAAMVAHNVRRLERLLSGLRWERATSAWSDYRQGSHYSEVDLALKRAFVVRAAARRQRRLVWDLGTNTGEHARAVAPHAGLVVAMDRDHLAVDLLFRRLAADGPANVVPLVIDLLDPSPGIGWGLRERRPLFDRGRPDLVIALALVHHLALTGNVPLPDLVDWLADLGADLVVEMVAPDDPMARQLLRNKDSDHSDYTLEAFEAFLARRFAVVEREALASGTRVLYALEARR